MQQNYDAVLVQQVQELASGESAHLSANLTGAYVSASNHYRETGNAAFARIAAEAEIELRVLLAKLRHRRAIFIRWL